MTILSGQLPRRSTVIEFLESPDLPATDLAHVLDFHAAVSRWTGGRSIIRNFLSASSPRTAGPLTVMEMGCGRGDLSRAIVQWARRSGVEVKVHGVDRCAHLIALAREWNRAYPEITFERRELEDPFFLQAQQFDFVVSESALHREPDGRTALFLKTANRMARRGIIAVDWIRDPRPLLVMEGLGRLFGAEAVRHDAPLAIERGFQKRDAELLRTSAGLDFARVGVHFGYRFSISGERGLARHQALVPLTGLAT